MSDPRDWIDDHAEAMFRYAVLQTRDPDAAEECVQETFVAALEARKTFRGESSPRTWLIGILRHKICDHFRRRSRQLPADEVPDLSGLFTEAGVWKQALGTVPWDLKQPLVREEFLSAFRECLAKLPPRMADLLCLRELHGLNTAVICQVMDISETNLWVQLHRARVLLRQCLERRGSR